MKQKVIGCAVASALGLLGGVQDSHAAAFALAEQGASGLGNAYAGAAAVAEDASTVWWNPAGMARLAAGKHFAAAGFLIVPSTNFSNRASVTAPASNAALTGNGGDAGGANLVPSFFFAMDLNPKWNFGLGVNVPFGLKTEYAADWIGRFHGISSEVKTLNINPAVSYKISDAASVGFGVSYQRGEIDLLSAVNYSGSAFALTGGTALAGGAGIEGQNKTSVDGDAWGFNIGGLFNVTPATRVGIHYRSALRYKLDGTTSFSNVPAGFAAVPALAAATSGSNVKLELKTPDNLSFSLAHTLNDRWLLLGDLTWTHWSRIKRLPLVRTSGAASGATLDTLVFDFENAWRASVGAHYKLDGAWTLKAGLAYDQSPVPNADSRTVRLPDNDRYWFAVGAKYQVSRNGAFDVGYTYIKVRDADINAVSALRGTVNGTYDANVHLLGVQYQHTF